jgi:hypothetical protein
MLAEPCACTSAASAINTPPTFAQVRLKQSSVVARVDGVDSSRALPTKEVEIAYNMKTIQDLQDIMCELPDSFPGTDPNSD